MNAPSPAMPDGGILPTDALQLLSSEGYQRLAEALRDLLAALPPGMPARNPNTATGSAREASILFTPFRPPPLDQGTWLDRARQVAIAQAHLRKEATEEATEWLDRRCGLSFDESQVERTALALDAQIRSWKRRRLPKLCWVFVHTWRERVFQPLGSECWPVSLIVGVDIHGYRVAADLVFGPAGEPHWDDVLKTLDTRGAALGNGGLTARMNSDLFQAASKRWPKAILQICQRHFLGRIASVQDGLSSPVIPSLDTTPEETLSLLRPLLESQPSLRPWIANPEHGQPSVFATARLGRDLKAALGSLQWMEREARNLRTRALQDDLQLGPAMKSRLLTAATIEWEGMLDLRRPFLDPEAIGESLSTGGVPHGDPA